jgi:hypothetical protein
MTTGFCLQVRIMPETFPACGPDEKRGKLDLKSNEINFLETTLSRHCGKVVKVYKGERVSMADNLDKMDTLMLGDSNLKTLTLENCVSIAICGGGVTQIGDFMNVCRITNFKRIVICSYGNDITNRPASWVLKNVSNQLSRIRRLGGHQVEIILVEPLTRYLKNKPDYEVTVQELFNKISCFSGAVKVENRIGKSSRKDMLTGPRDAVGRRCFRDDGTHLQGPAIKAYGRLLQYFVSREDMKYDTGIETITTPTTETDTDNETQTDTA